MAFKIVVVGTSLGGLRALEVLLAGLAADFSLPMAVVQHRSVESGEVLQTVLQRHTHLRVREPQDKEPVVPGRVYLAPPDYHLLVEDGAFSLSTEGRVSYARPSVDVLFESAADSYGGEVIAVALTGANHDGARGAAVIKRRGGLVLVQAPDDAESPQMPRAVIAATPVDRILALSEIPVLLNELSGSGRESS